MAEQGRLPARVVEAAVMERARRKELQAKLHVIRRAADARGKMTVALSGIGCTLPVEKLTGAEVAPKLVPFVNAC